MVSKFLTLAIFSTLLLTPMEGVPVRSCSEGLPAHQDLSSAPESCLLAQRTQMSSGLRTMVTEALGESESYSHMMTSRVDSRARASMAVDSRASMGSQAMQWLAYRGNLPGVLAQLESSRLTANGQLEELIDKFIAKQSGSDDACHSQLLEAKHQLNSLHQHVHDLSMEVNATDHEVTALNEQVEAKLQEYDKLNEECNSKLQDIENEKKENLEKLKTYRDEMEEMKQIANPNVSMDQKNLTIIGSLVQHGLKKYVQEKQGASLMQFSAEESKHRLATASKFSNDMNKDVFMPLKLAMASVQKCMQTSQSEPHKIGMDASLLSVEQNVTTTTTTFDMSHKKIDCGKNTSVRVKIGDVEKEIVPRRGLTEGDHTSIPCSSINSKFTGAIWLDCTANGLKGNVSMCVHSETNATKCEAEKATLVEVFIKVYVELAQLISDYEEQTTTGYETSKEAEENQCRDRRKPLQDETARISSLATEKVKQLEELRPKLEDATEAEAKLREQVKKLSDECALLPNTTSDLDKVRDAIKALSLCPGLQGIAGVQLRIPTFVGRFIDFSGDATASKDEDLDAAMTTACQNAFSTANPGVEIRAAEVSELVQNATHNMPVTNTAGKPLIAACPGCEGDADSGGTTHPSGHARICFEDGAELKLASARRNCAVGPFSIACVAIAVPTFP